MDQGITICKVCLIPLTPIGFVQKEKPDIGGTVERGTCGCGKPTGSKGIDNKGRRRYRSQCDPCRIASLKHRKNTCEFCGVEPEGKGMIDIDHIDGNRSNNNPENLQSLCKDCHKAKTTLDVEAKLYKKVRENINGKNG
jgi:5-methylcytosine-specific restriction endonuclease McrA